MKTRSKEILIAPMLILAACNNQLQEGGDKPSNAVRADITKIDMKRIRNAMPGATEQCLRKIEKGGFEAIPINTDACFEMLPQQRWHGFWRYDFEGSQFCPAPAKACPSKWLGDLIWFTQGSFKGEIGALYEVDFIGRRTKVKGNYGHMGMAAYEVIVDRPISIKLITSPPPPPTEAELIADWRRCEAAHQCIPSDEMRKMMDRKR